MKYIKLLLSSLLFEFAWDYMRSNRMEKSRCFLNWAERIYPGPLGVEHALMKCKYLQVSGENDEFKKIIYETVIRIKKMKGYPCDNCLYIHEYALKMIGIFIDQNYMSFEKRQLDEMEFGRKLNFNNENVSKDLIRKFRIN